jgi:transcriptional regulator with XRE-family HTH domain
MHPAARLSLHLMHVNFTTMQNTLGVALRNARVQAGLTLERLAEATELSAGFLSRLERDLASTSVSNLIRLATVLGVRLDRLLPAGQTAPDPTGYTLRRARDGEGFSAGAYRYKALAGGLPHQAMSAFELFYPPGRGEELGTYEHEGEEVLYVLSGKLDFTIGGKRVRLETGDCLQFNARQPHFARNPGKTPARLLMIVTGHHPSRPAMPSFAAPGRTSIQPERKTRHEQRRTKIPAAG